MILNAYAVLDGFLSLFRVVLGLLVLGLGSAAWWSWRRQAADPEKRKALEDRCYLLFMLGGFLLVLNILSWPVFYLLLQSYVPEWPGVMCIYGVTRIGANSIGPARFLPGLVTTLQTTKPALVFLSGAWFVLYLVNRRTRTAPLTGRVLACLLIAGLLGAGDAVAESAYLGIPKKEEFYSSGCCTAALNSADSPSRLLPRSLTDPRKAPHAEAFYFGLNVAFVVALAVAVRLSRSRPRPGWLALLLAGALVSLLYNAVFLVGVACPLLIRLPEHRCAYDLVPRAPESLVAIALFFTGVFAVGWACVAAWFGNSSESRPVLPEMVSRLLFLGFLGCLWSITMMSVELALT
jgi:hypothetical protein